MKEFETTTQDLANAQKDFHTKGRAGIDVPANATYVGESTS